MKESYDGDLALKRFELIQQTNLSYECLLESANFLKENHREAIENVLESANFLKENYQEAIKTIDKQKWLKTIHEK